MITVQRLLTTMVECVPQSVKIALRGKRGAPRRLANAIHSILNRMPGERYPVLNCSGVLKGYRMKVDWTKHRSFAYGTWEPEVVGVITQNVRPGMVALDIGAHSGYYTLMLSKLVGAKGRVIAFEPLPPNFRILQENVELNRATNVQRQQQAVGERSGEGILIVPDPMDSLVAGPMIAADPRGIMRVPTVSLDDFLFEHGTSVDFVKMDVEGAEGDILRGARRTLETFHPCMMVELHDMEKQEGRHHPVADLMEEFGYEIRWLSEVGYTAHTFAQWKPKAAAYRNEKQRVC